MLRKFLERLFRIDGALSVGEKTWSILSYFFPGVAAAIVGYLSSQAAWFWGEYGAFGVAAAAVLTFYFVAAGMSGIARFGDWWRQARERRAGGRPEPQATAAHVTKINIVAGLTPQSCPVLLSGVHAKTGPRLRIVLEHSHSSPGVNFSEWTRRTPVTVAEIRDFVSGQRLAVPLAARSADGTRALWPTDGSRQPEEIKLGTKYRVRLRFISDGAPEQVFGFVLVGMPGDREPYFATVVVATDFRFLDEWAS